MSMAALRIIGSGRSRPSDKDREVTARSEAREILRKARELDNAQGSPMASPVSPSKIVPSEGEALSKAVEAQITRLEVVAKEVEDAAKGAARSIIREKSAAIAAVHGAQGESRAPSLRWGAAVQPTTEPGRERGLAPGGDFLTTALLPLSPSSVEGRFSTWIELKTGPTAWWTDYGNPDYLRSLSRYLYRTTASGHVHEPDARMDALHKALSIDPALTYVILISFNPTDRKR